MTDTEVTLIPDTIKGVREFNADQYGRLKGPNQGTLWRPGWNKARHGSSGYSMPTNHRVAGAACACGFYAYFSDKHTSHRTKTTVTGVIEAKGLCSVSDKGFRAAEARVIALAPSDEGRFAWWHWLMVMILPPWSFIIVPLVIAHAVLAGVKDPVGWWFGPAFGLALVCTVIGVIGFFATLSEHEELFDWKPWTYAEQKGLLKRNYPEAQVFNSRRKMLRKIKLSESPVRPTVYGPESEGFWS